ncbi:hypothetical protein ASD11_11310 [Aeromicrobium sp. Root495]|uniref:acetyltransferase n=1 Tax=Aeromicrobium sp. Root495 TaxID=1736550 RepID=UPI0006FCF128|nr:acetyltransferase [Aeromicrobium sp. Root495]KQY60076.1 hypothetical protein ASD11_11310 [Aeromicrobium sp. Root495]
MRDLVIIGCGGFGRETSDVVAAVNASSPRWNLLGFLDDTPSEENLARVRRLGLEVIGTVADAHTLTGAAYVIGVGSGRARESIASQLDDAGLEAVTLIHPSATIGSDTSVGPGAVVCAQASITTNVVIGRHVHVDRGSTVGHDSTLDDYATMHPLSCLSGSVRLGARVQLGTHAVVLPGRSVGDDSVVGAAACVVHDVPAGATVKGVPAR